MTFLYPASHDLKSLSTPALYLKIARHSRCSTCNSCSGLHPPRNTSVILDTYEPDDALGSEDEHEHDTSSGYLRACDCGHSLSDHGADESIGQDEILRRGRVAVRLDELLSDIGRLLDFDYTDEDIDSLRMQMKLPDTEQSPFSDEIFFSESVSSLKHVRSPDSSALSDAPQPGLKRTRSSGSESSLSSAGDKEEDEEDKPLASLASRTSKSSRPQTSKSTRTDAAARHGQQRSGKKMSSMKSVAQTAPSSKSVDPRNRPDIGGHRPGAPPTEIRVDEHIDEKQLTRLATGVTVDTGATVPTPTTAKPEKAVYSEMREGIIRVTAVENDGDPRSLVILTGLKTLFQKQLPKMPREYIARLVFDSNSKALAFIKYGYKVVGGICYRPFPHRGFAEIVFFATMSVDQDKGYGRMLMNHFKDHIRRTYPDMMYFLTYADNYAVGYFKKQGFSKDITLDRSIWAGYIKDYEGGTIMQCKLLPKVDYLNTMDLIAQQREAILSKIREMSRSHIVHPGLKAFKSSDGDGFAIDPSDVPGLRETGWAPNMQTEPPRLLGKNASYTNMRRILSDLQNHSLAWPFLQPVSKEEVPDYHFVINNPMDFGTMEQKLEHNLYSSMDSFVDDAMLVFRNCRSYNPEGTIYVKNANKLEAHLKELLDKLDPG